MNNTESAMPPRKKSKNSGYSQSSSRKDVNKPEKGKGAGVNVVDLTHTTMDQESQQPNDAMSSTCPQFTEDEDWNMQQMVKEAEELYGVAEEEVSLEMRFHPAKRNFIDAVSKDISASSTCSEIRKEGSEVRVLAVLDGIDDPLPPGLLDAMEKAERQLAPQPSSPSPNSLMVSNPLPEREEINDSTPPNAVAVDVGRADIRSPEMKAPDDTPLFSTSSSVNPSSVHLPRQLSPKPAINPKEHVATSNQPGSAGKTTLTAEQRLIMEENKRKAKERKEKKEKLLLQQQQEQHHKSSCHLSYPPPPTKPLHNAHSSIISNLIVPPPSSPQHAPPSSSSSMTSYSLLPNKRPLPNATTNDYLLDSGSSMEESQSGCVTARLQFNHSQHQNDKKSKIREQPADLPESDNLYPTSNYPPPHLLPSQQQRPQPPQSSLVTAPVGLFTLPVTIPSTILSRCLIYNWPSSTTTPLTDKKYEMVSFAVGFSTTEVTPITNTYIDRGKGLVLYFISGVHRKRDNYALYLAAKLAWDHGAALLAIVLVDEEAENDLSKCMELHRSSAVGGFQAGWLDSRENSFIRKNVSSLSAKSGFASSLQEMGISIIGLVGQSNQSENTASTCITDVDDEHHDSLQVESLMAFVEKITSSGDYKLQGIISDYTGHPAVHHMNRELSKKLPFVPHIAVDSSSLLCNPHKPEIDVDGTFTEFLRTLVFYVSQGNNISSNVLPDVLSLVSKDRQEGLCKHLTSCLPAKGPKVISSTTSPFKISLIDWKRVNAALQYHSTCIVTSDKFSLWSEASVNEQLDKLVEDVSTPREINDSMNKRNDIFTGSTICVVNMIQAGIISSSSVLARVQSMTKGILNINTINGKPLVGNDFLSSLIYQIAWMEYGAFRARTLFKEVSYTKIKVDDGLPAHPAVLWYSMLTQGLGKGNSSISVFSKYKLNRAKKYAGVSWKPLTPVDLAHGKTGDALFDCIQNVLVHYGFEPTPGPVLYYWLATICLRLPSIQDGLKVATCQISTHSLHSAETSAFLVPSILNAMTELNNFISSDVRFKEDSGEDVMDILNVLRDIIIEQVGSKIQLDYLLSVYCKATEIHEVGN